MELYPTTEQVYLPSQEPTVTYMDNTTHFIVVLKSSILNSEVHLLRFFFKKGMSTAKYKLSPEVDWEKAGVTHGTVLFKNSYL